MKDSPQTHDMIGAEREDFLQGLARSQIGVHGQAFTAQCKWGVTPTMFRLGRGSPMAAVAELGTCGARPGRSPAAIDSYRHGLLPAARGGRVGTCLPGRGWTAPASIA